MADDVVEGQAVEGNTADDVADDQTADTAEDVADDHAAEDLMAEDHTPEDQTADNTPDDHTADTAEDQTTENHAADDHTADPTTDDTTERPRKHMANPTVTVEDLELFVARAEYFSFAESDYQAVKKVMLEMVRAAGGAEA